MARGKELLEQDIVRISRSIEDVKTRFSQGYYHGVDLGTLKSSLLRIFQEVVSIPAAHPRELRRSSTRDALVEAEANAGNIILKEDVGLVVSHIERLSLLRSRDCYDGVDETYLKSSLFCIFALIGDLLAEIDALADGGPRLVPQVQVPSLKTFSSSVAPSAKLDERPASRTSQPASDLSSLRSTSAAADVKIQPPSKTTKRSRQDSPVASAAAEFQRRAPDNLNANIVRKICPADLLGLKCREDAKDGCGLRRLCESLQRRNGHICPGPTCPHLHGVKVSCPNAMMDKGICPTPCVRGHNFLQARKATYVENRSHCPYMK
ncbi:hypothetical protein FQN54_003605 [Arachnomyces sp. PD_36]|nr:hypothetical protein FQN54_003605 [Arachnomyces sp. PD_36]